MEYVHVTNDHLEEEHICCALSNNKDVQVSSKKAYVLYYTNQCPFNAKYVPVLEQTAKENGIAFKANLV